MSYLPAGYSAPKTDSKYLKPIEGKVRFRIVSDLIIGFEYWNNNKKPVRSKEAPKEKPADIRLNDDGSYSIKHFWAFTVIDRNDLGGVLKVMEITQGGIMGDLEAIFTDPDWGDPRNFDITITGEGKGLERRYSTMPNPPKELTAEEKETIKKNKVNLNAMFYGADPFDEKWEEPKNDIGEEQEEVSTKDIPF